MSYRLLTAFQEVFDGRQYRHRDSSIGDFVAVHFYEDLFELGKSEHLQSRILSQDWVVNRANKRQGIQARRGDGTFGEIVPGETPIVDLGYRVARARVATMEIGVEVKVLAKAMIKQIDRVTGDLIKQVSEFQQGNASPISIAIVGVNYAPRYTSYENDRIYRTDGSGIYRHPIQEALTAERRLLEFAKPKYDEFLILRFSATNESPYPFSWINQNETIRDYAAILLRVSRSYEQRFVRS